MSTIQTASSTKRTSKRSFKLSTAALLVYGAFSLAALALTIFTLCF